MREMTPTELHYWYDKGQWPCGHGTKYLEGPRGGASLNVECPICHMQLNVLDPAYGLRAMFGQVLYAPAGYIPPYEPATPFIKWEHVDGPMLVTTKGHVHFLTPFERAMMYIGIYNIQRLNEKYNRSSSSAVRY